MSITPEQARELLDGATPSPWRFTECESIIPFRVDFWDDDEMAHKNANLAAAAPDLAQTIAGMTEEWGVETKSHQFGLHWEWYDNEAAAKKAHGYQVDIWRARNRQKVMPIRRRFIMEVIDGE